MWIVDPPDRLEGRCCLLCREDGIEKEARFRDPNGAPICEAHFIVMVQLCAKLRAHAHQGNEAHRFNRHKGGPGGRASAAARLRRRQHALAEENHETYEH